MISVEDLKHTTWRVLHFVSQQDETAVRSNLDVESLAVFEIHGREIKTKEQLLASIAQAMQFPSDFGMNWDALDDYLRDMMWLPAKGYVLFVRDAQQFWANCAQLAGGLVESWLLAAEYWGQHGVPFHLVFVW